MESIEDAVQALQDVGADDTINRLAKGLNTHLVSGGKGYSSSMINKIILARCLAKKPHLIILNDFFSGLKKQEKISQIQCVTAVDKKWTLLAVSNDPMVMAACDRVVVLKDGRIEVEGTFRDLFNNGSITNYLD